MGLGGAALGSVGTCLGLALPFNHLVAELGTCAVGGAAARVAVRLHGQHSLNLLPIGLQGATRQGGGRRRQR